jgi:hypothetical protein
MENLMVYQAIAAVTANLSKQGIAKDKKNVQQGYSFRGIDDVYNALAPFLSEQKLCILPRVLSREISERESQKGGALFSVTVCVEFDIVSAEDGSRHVVKLYGEAMDSGDKATNKAMSAAYKYMAMEVFCIPTEGDNDADANTHTVKPKATITPTSGAWEAMSEGQQAALLSLASDVLGLLAQDDALAACRAIEDATLGADEMVALWSRLGSKERSALKRAKQVSSIKSGMLRKDELARDPASQA